MSIFYWDCLLLLSRDPGDDGSPNVDRHMRNESLRLAGDHELAQIAAQAHIAITGIGCPTGGTDARQGDEGTSDTYVPFAHFCVAEHRNVNRRSRTEHNHWRARTGSRRLRASRLAPRRVKGGTQPILCTTPGTSDESLSLHHRGDRRCRLRATLHRRGR